MKILEKINGFVWGIPALVMIVGVGIYLSAVTGFIQLRMLPEAFRVFFSRFRTRKDKSDGITPYQTLCTALAATVGTGNMAGVAGAIAIGGPGAVFWMWICAILGMGIKFAEVTLAVRYRQKNAKGEWVGGPMYMIRSGMGKKWGWLAGVYCFFGVVAAFGMGNATQINTVVSSIDDTFAALGMNLAMQGNLLTGLFLASVILCLFLGGAKRIAVATEKLIPVASLLYLGLGAGVLAARLTQIPNALRMILCGAFSPSAFTGGVVGSVFTSVRIGTSRGVFTNEAGMGTASISYASAPKGRPLEQGLMGIMEVFIDTVVICTMTALVILCSNVAVPYGTDTGITLTLQAFSAIYGKWIHIPITACLCAFAFATVLGWGLYGIRCAQYLFGDGVWRKFAVIQAGIVVIGAVLKTGTVWMLSETVNGLMVVPNLIAVAALSPELKRLIHMKNGEKLTR